MRGDHAVYLAGPFVSGPMLEMYAHEIKGIGYAVTSRWFRANAHNGEDLIRYALEDLADVAAAGVFIGFTAAAVNAPVGKGGSGGRHVELGYALANHKSILMVGAEPENIFHHLPQINWVADWHDAVLWLARRISSNPPPVAAEEVAS